MLRVLFESDVNGGCDTIVILFRHTPRAIFKILDLPPSVSVRPSGKSFACNLQHNLLLTFYVWEKFNENCDFLNPK